MGLSVLSKLPFHGLNFCDTKIIIENVLLYICECVCRKKMINYSGEILSFCYYNVFLS